MLFAIFCTDKEDYLDVRMYNRPAHVDYLKAQGEQLLFAEPTLAEDGESMNGRLVVVVLNSLELANKAECHDTRG